jgi:pimeloyl-ACP methyl ester carboxylesterase
MKLLILTVFIIFSILIPCQIVLLNNSYTENLPYDFDGFNENYYSCEKMNIRPYIIKGGVYYIVMPKKCKNKVKDNSLVIFIPGWPVMIPDTYFFWLEHLAKRGNIVLYATYYPFKNSKRYTGIVYSMVIDTLNLLGEKNINIENIAIVGHSSGGYIAMNIASMISDNKDVAPAKAIMALEPGNGSYVKDNNLIPFATGFSLKNLSNLNRDTLLLILIGEASTDDFLENSINIYDLTKSIPPTNKNIIMFKSVNKDNEKLIANHFFPVSWGLIPGVGIGEDDAPKMFDLLDIVDGRFNFFDVDILDYKLWNLFDALMDAAFYNIRKDDALGGTDKQTFMGYWPDGSEIDRPVILK